MIRAAIIIGSTRPERNAVAVAQWVYERAKGRTDAEYELVDLKDFNLPLLDEAVPATFNQYSQPHTKIWSEKINSFDAYIFVTPEYNHGTSAALKNAIDFLYHEWNNKAAAFVSYGSSNGVRAIEQLRQVMSEIMIADVRAHVGFSLFTDFVNFNEFKPAEFHNEHARTMFEQLVSWGEAMKTIRDKRA